MDFRAYKHLKRGIRNNNPGNIEKTTIPWKGKVESDDTRFEQFKSVEYGIRAMMRNIVTKFKRGENSISDLIKEWAPMFENDTHSYIMNVSRELGISPEARITYLDENRLIALSRAIAKVENAPDDAKISMESYKKAYEMIGYNVKSYRFSSLQKKKPINQYLLLTGALGIIAVSLWLMAKNKQHEYSRAIQ